MCFKFKQNKRETLQIVCLTPNPRHLVPLASKLLVSLICFYDCFIHLKRIHAFGFCHCFFFFYSHSGIFHYCAFCVFIYYTEGIIPIYKVTHRYFYLQCIPLHERALNYISVLLRVRILFHDHFLIPVKL